MIHDPTEIIIYRNRAEYELWNSDALFPVMVASVLCIIVALIVAKVWDKWFPHQWGAKQGQGNAVIVSMVVTFGFTLYIML